MSGKYAVPLVACCCLAVLTGSVAMVRAADARIARLDRIIGHIQEVILHATGLYKSGKLKPGHPFVAKITPKVQLAFHAQRFTADLKTAFNVHDRLVLYRRKMAGVQNGHARHAAAHPKKNRRQVAAVDAPEPADDISAMRQAEKQTAAAAPRSHAQLPLNYDIYQDYRKAHAGRLRQQDRAAEADMAAVLNERKAAEAAQLQMRRRKQQLQAQATKWQAELDRQASQSAKAAAKWESEHSFGAYATRFLGTVLQTAVGSFSTAFLTPVATGLANRAVKSLFPSVNTASLAAQAATSSATRVAVTNLGSAAGQAAANGATNRLSGTAGPQGLQPPAY